MPANTWGSAGGREWSKKALYVCILIEHLPQTLSWLITGIPGIGKCEGTLHLGSYSLNNENFCACSA